LKDLTGIELGSAIIAALAHDIGHPGVTNRYLITNKEKIAMRYNDVSVLENMHAALLYKILGKEECNILRNLPHEDWTDSRRCIIGMILSTDMGKHFEVLGQFRARTQTSSDINLQKSEDRMFLLSMAIKCADLGHSAKPVLLHQKWSELVLAEFFSQGDLERDKGLPVSMYCDRDTTDIPKSQAGFIRNICLPLFEAWTDYLRCEEVNRVVLQQLAENLGMWEAKGRLPAVQRDRGSPNPKVAVGLSMEDLEEM
jgi:3',5'-cyclic-nucleotide phosphodiesterase/cAMP-specific phosphodiesterase 4